MQRQVKNIAPSVSNQEDTFLWEEEKDNVNMPTKGAATGAFVAGRSVALISAGTVGVGREGGGVGLTVAVDEEGVSDETRYSGRETGTWSACTGSAGTGSACTRFGRTGFAGAGDEE